jgi:hypothetical protein
MIIESIYMNDPYGVEVGDGCQITFEVRRDDFVRASVSFWTPVNSVMPEHPQDNRYFTWEGIELLSDDEILAQLLILVPELKK